MALLLDLLLLVKISITNAGVFFNIGMVVCCNNVNSFLHTRFFTLAFDFLVGSSVVDTSPVFKLLGDVLYLH